MCFKKANYMIIIIKKKPVARHKAGAKERHTKTSRDSAAAMIGAQNVKCREAKSYLTVTVFKQLRAGININIYAYKHWLKVYITAEKYMS